MSDVTVNGYRITIHRKLSPSPATARALDTLLDGRSGLAGNDRPEKKGTGFAAPHSTADVFPTSPERLPASVAVAGG